MKREKLYDNLINSGLVSEKHVGTKETFLSRVNSAEKASAFYNNLINSGLVSEKHVGTEDAFLKSIMPDFEQTADTVRRGTGDSTQQEAGFWHTWFGDALQRVTAGADNMAGNLIKGVNEVGQLPNYALTYAKTGQWEAPGKENTVLGKTASWLKGEAEDLRGKSQRYGTVTDENGMERPKNFKDLWKEGDYLGAVGETFLSASESLPVSLTAMAAGPAGLGLIGASTGIEKYDELSKTNPEMPWYSKAINAGTTGVIEGASERLGALFDTKLLKTLYKGAGASKAKGIFTNTLLGTLKESGVEGAEEVASAIGENVTDYMTGAADRFEPFKGVPESFVYGAAGGMQFAAPVAVASATGQAKQKQYINALITDAIDVNHYFDFQNLSAEEKQVIQTGYGKAEQRLNSALQNGSPEEFQAILDIVAMPMATQRKALQGIIDNSALNESQKMAIFNYVQKANARKGMENAMQTQIETAQKQAVETIRPYINPDMNAIVTVTTNGQQRQITGGNIILTEEGKIDMEKSSKEVYYTDENGKKQVAATGMIDLQEIIPAEEAVSRVMELVSTPIIAGHENAVTQPCNLGEMVRTQDGLTGTVAGKNEDGTYQLSIPGMPEPVNVEPRLILSNLRGIETGSTVDFIDANGNVSTGEVEDTGTFESGLFVINGKEIPIDRIKGLHTENQNNGADNDNSRIIDVLTGKKPEQENENDKQKRLFYETLPKNSKGETDEKTMTDAQKLQHLEYKRGKEFAVDAARKGKQNTETEIKKLQSRFEKESDLMQLDRLQEQIDFLTARVKTYADYVYAFQKATMQANIDRSTPNQEQANEEKRLLDEQKRTETERANREAIAREQIKGVPDISRDSAKNARRRGYRLSEGSRIDRQPEITDIKGATVTRKFSDTETIPATRTVINAAILQPSHKNGTRNHHFFITEAQPKERTDDATLIAAENIAKNINPQEITGGTTAYTGAPIVNTRGEVIQGNNRTAALQQMYEQFPQQAVQYKQYLADHAADYGMTAEEINAMEHPVAADIIAVSDEKAIRLGQLNAADTESGGTQRIQPAQAAAQLGENLGRFTEILFNSIGEELSLSELIHKNAKRALDYLITKGIINNTQYLSAFDRQQNLKPEAKADMAGIATQALFSGSNDTFAQRFDMLPAKAKTAILQTIHRDSKSDEDSKLVNDIRQAVEIYSILSQNADFTNAKAEAETRSAVWAWSRQMHMDFTEGNFIPSDRYGNLAMELAVRFHSQTAATQRQIFNMLYDNLQGISSDMFIRAEKLDKRDAIKKHFNIEYNDNELQGSHAMADNSRDGEGRQQGSPSVPAGGKQPAAGKQPADSGRGELETIMSGREQK
jgi:hypothetical protein